MSPTVPEWKIAKAGKPTLGWEDHGILTAYVPLDYGGSFQSLGGFCLSWSPPPNHEERYHSKSMEWCARLMKAFGVREWSEIEGCTVFVRADYEHVYGVKPLPTESGEEFIFDEFEWGDEAR